MKRIILFFAVCLGLSVSQTTFADNSENVRTATKRTPTTTVSQKRGENQSVKSARGATTSTQQRIVSRPSSSQTQGVKPRTTTKSTATRSSTPARSTVQNKTSARSATQQNRKSVSRAATELNETKIESIKSADYSKCRTIYYECMDEFCANKDTNLRRCACSSRIHEFDNIKKQLNDAEDKMLDFNQRLLTVSLDKEDAAAINVATEGETAFYTKDRSESEKLLQKITKTLNNSADSKITNDLSAISLSLDVDTAWDDIDSLSGVATSSKSGLDLYNAARPICIEMAKEVCSDEELSIAQDGYKLTIQQDCNTVAKSYNTLYNNAMEKIHESSALLDISRLNSYQQRNSDDTLTCKKKILEQLSDTSVCGADLYKCLDVTGEYIDPSTGQAFLSENLYNITSLIQEPVGEEKWSRIAQNEPFVNFLKSKKKFLTPAIEQCRDISDTIWSEFLDDALSQIKLAQNAKLEEIKQSCTKLVSECKTNALKDLSEFDSRALSVFSVAADKTANTMCSDVQNSCVAIMGISDLDNDWGTGISGIATNISYDKVIETCTQIGRECIIQKCNGASGNFALCTNTMSDNRISILRRDSCWEDVLNCVASADNLETMQPTYTEPVPYPDADTHPYYDTACDSNDKVCLITKQIWGNCEADNRDIAIITSDNIPDGILHISSNKISIPDTGSTLLSWFATNTGTTNSITSCNTYDCPINYYKDANGTCQLLAINTTTDGITATSRSQIINVIINAITNFCETGVRDTFGNCCASGYKSNGICVPEPINDTPYNALRLLTSVCNDEDSYICPGHDSSNPRQIYHYCITTNDYVEYDSNNGYICNGFWVFVDQYGNYFDEAHLNASNQLIIGSDAPDMTFRPNDTDTCTYVYQNAWSFSGQNCTITDAVPTSNEFMITYQP